MTRDGLQLAIPVDADDLGPGEIAAVDAHVQHERDASRRHLISARPCRCDRPWPLEPGACLKCGRATTNPKET